MQKYLFHEVEMAYRQSEHKRLYKAKKRWLVSSLSVATLALGTMAVSEAVLSQPAQTVHAGGIPTPMTVSLGTTVNTKVYDGTPDFADIQIAKITGISNPNVPTLTPDDIDFSAVGADAGSYDIALSPAGEAKVLAANPDCTDGIKKASGRVTITKRPITITPDNLTWEVGTPKPAYTATVDGLLPGMTAPAYTIQTTREIAEGNFGTTTLEVIYDKNEKNFKIDAKTGTLTVTGHVMSAQVGNVTKEEDGYKIFTTVPTVTMSNGDVITDLTTDDFNWDQVQAAPGRYAITLSNQGIAAIKARYGSSTSLPDDQITAGYAIITAKGGTTTPATALHATVGGLHKTYDGNTTFTDLPEVTLDNGATVPTLTATDFDFSKVQANAGNYTVTLTQSGVDKIVAANTDTTLALTDVKAGQVVIDKAEATITADAANKVEGDADPALTATVEGAVNGETLNYTVARDAGETAGDYAITVTAGTNPNYDVKVTGETFTITAKPVAPKTALKATVGDLRKTYDGTTDFADLPAVTLDNGATVPTLTAADFDVSAVLADAGNYTVTLNQAGVDKLVAANANTTLVLADVTAGQVVIDKAQATITANDANKVEGDAEPALTATVDGAVNGETLDYTVARDAGETAGDYAITVTAGANPNYAVTVAGGTFTINEQPVTPTTVLHAMVAGLTKTYDGNVDFTDVPAVILDHGATVPTLTADDFDFSEVQADAGTYTVTLNQSGVDKIVAANTDTTLALTDVTAGQVVIDKAQATITADDANKIEGDAEPTLTATVDGAVNGETLNYTVARDAGETAGDYAITVTAGSNPNYDVTVAGGTFTITAQATTALHATVGELRKTYDGTAAFTDLPAVTLDNGATVPTLTVDDFDFSEVQADAGTYTVTLSQSGVDKIVAANTDTTLALTDVTAGQVVIDKAQATITADDANKVEGDTEPTLTATVDGAVNGETLDYTVARDAGETAGDYAITVTAGANPNYDVTVAGGTFTITAPAFKATIGEIRKVYDGTTAFSDLPEVTLTNGATVPVLTVADFNFDAVGAGAGRYQLTLSQSGLDKLAAADPSLALTADDVSAGRAIIEQAQATITVDDLVKIDGDPDPVLTATVTGTVAGETLDYTLTRDPGDRLGAHAINVTLGDNLNYAIQVTPGTLTIKPRPVVTTTALTATVGGLHKTYDGTPAFTDLPAVTLDNGAMVPTLTIDDFDFSGVQADAGTYTVTLNQAGVAKIVAANASTTLALADVTAGQVVIDKAEATITADDANKVEGDAEPALTATVDGAVNGETLDYAVTRDAGETAGDYAITVTAGANPNYDVTVAGGTFTITAQPATVLHATVSGLTKTYDGTPAFTDLPAVTLDNGATVPTLTVDDFDFSAVEANAGSYVVTLSQSGVDKLVAANANTTLAMADVTAGQVVIDKAQATITADDANKVEGDAEPTLTATVDGAVNGETLDYTVTRDAGETAGDYAITVTAGTNPNYAVTVAGGTFTISEQPATPTIALHATVGGLTKTYDGTPAFTDLPTVTLDNGATVPALTADDFDFSAVEANAGSYTVTLSQAGVDKLVAANANTTLALADVTAGQVVIDKAQATITADAAGKVEGAAEPTLTATVDGAVNGETLDYTVARDAGETAGDYAITVTAGSNPNYDVTVAGGTFTISDQPATPTTALHVMISALTKTYDGTAAFTDLPAVTLDNGATVPALTADDFDFSAVEANAGSYTVTLSPSGVAKLLAANPNTTLALADITGGAVVIDKAPVTITADAATKTEGAADPTLTATVVGAVAGETLDYTVTRDAGEATGDYALTVTVGDNPNYDVTVVTAAAGWFTISEPQVTPATALHATVGGLTKTYDGTTTFPDLPAVTLDNGVTVPDLTADDFDFSAVDANAGSYTVTLSPSGVAKLLAANPNTTLALADITAGTVVIDKAQATITAAAATKVEGAAEPTLTATVTGAVDGETLDYTVAREPGEAAGDYAITVTAGDDPNYTVTLVGSTFTIVAATPDDPDQSGDPDNSGDPDQSGDPDNSGDPDQSGDPDNSGDPDQSGDPDNSGDPDQSGDPDTPVKPDVPGTPVKRVTPTEPAAPNATAHLEEAPTTGTQATAAAGRGASATTLPQTGETPSLLGLLGMMIMGMIGALGIHRRSPKTK
ncbi:MBG domain-containing protein [Lacticaseibacillus absianus]|uniref:MBG domain-containing protein n=1 Tax=Lacticaseibacillus absianus TaxID=2729623 RepID=UPI0015CD454C|nr:MBG domain-containing protein [Lacticaseibacillus absianus]